MTSIKKILFCISGQRSGCISAHTSHVKTIFQKKEEKETKTQLYLFFILQTFDVVMFICLTLIHQIETECHRKPWKLNEWISIRLFFFYFVNDFPLLLHFCFSIDITFEIDPISLVLSNTNMELSVSLFFYHLRVYWQQIAISSE